jgi:hypothetical protein
MLQAIDGFLPANVTGRDGRSLNTSDFLVNQSSLLLWPVDCQLYCHIVVL